MGVSIFLGRARDADGLASAEAGGTGRRPGHGLGRGVARRGVGAIGARRALFAARGVRDDGDAGGRRVVLAAGKTEFARRGVWGVWSRVVSGVQGLDAPPGLDAIVAVARRSQARDGGCARGRAGTGAVGPDGWIFCRRPRGARKSRSVCERRGIFDEPIRWTAPPAQSSRWTGGGGYVGGLLRRHFGVAGARVRRARCGCAGVASALGGVGRIGRPGTVVCGIFRDPGCFFRTKPESCAATLPDPRGDRGGVGGGGGWGLAAPAICCRGYSHRCRALAALAPPDCAVIADGVFG